MEGFFTNLSDGDRLRLLTKLFLSTRTQFVVQRIHQPEFAPVDVNTQVQIAQTYLETGSLQKAKPQEYYIILLSVVKHCPTKLFPAEFAGLHFAELSEQLQPEHKEAVEKLCQFGCEAARKGWISPVVLTRSIADTLVNYKSTKKVFKKCCDLLQTVFAQESA